MDWEEGDRATHKLIEPRWMGMKGALATRSPSGAKRAQEKSRRSLMFVLIAVCWSERPIASATLMKRFAKSVRRMGSGGLYFFVCSVMTAVVCVLGSKAPGTGLLWREVGMSVLQRASLPSQLLIGASVHARLQNDTHGVPIPIAPLRDLSSDFLLAGFAAQREKAR